MVLQESRRTVSSACFKGDSHDDGYSGLSWQLLCCCVSVSSCGLFYRELDSYHVPPKERR